MRKTFARCFVAIAPVVLAVLGSLAPARAAVHPVPATPQTIAVYATVLRHINPQMPGWQSRDLARRVLVSAERWHLDTNMLIAIVTVESSWHTHAVSSAGAIGLGQLMPGTAALLGVNPHDPTQNLLGAARYLRGLVKRFGPHHYDLVNEYGGIPPYDETQAYVVRVLDEWAHLSRTVHLPRSYGAELPAHGLDIDYWLDASTTP
jgi:soluble lytic murein transglycosylase-like protein